jgi:hypothetical protein
MSIIEQPSKADLLAVWHKRHPWKSHEESEELFDYYLSLGHLDVTRASTEWRVNIVTKKTRQ